MLKKVFVIALIAVGVGYAINKTRIGSHMRTEAEEVQAWLDDQVPVEKEIKVLRSEVTRLDRDLSKIKDKLAKEISDMKDLQKETTALAAQVDDENTNLMVRLTKIRDAADNKVSLGRETISVREAQNRLALDTRIWEKRKNTLRDKEITLKYIEQNVETMLAQKAEMERQQTELRVEIDAIEAEYKTLQLQEMKARSTQGDDSRLNKINESLQKLRKKLDVRQERLKLDGVPVDTRGSGAPAETLDELESRLNGN